MDIRTLKSVYFLGIGGIGMSALARFFALRGVKVSGYDRTPTPLTDQLIADGINIHFEDDISLIPGKPELVIYTPAVPKDHKEFNYLLGTNTPVMKRAEVLGLISGHFRTIAVAGTHGKTTTSTIITHLLRFAKIDHLAFLGGISKNYGTNFLQSKNVVFPALTKENTATGSMSPPAHFHQPVYCIVEADEYDKSFLQLTPYIAVITSADADHLDIYGNHDDLKKTFAEFTAKIVDQGSLILKSGTNIKPVNKNSYYTYSYSLSGDATFYPKNVRLKDELIHFDFVTPTETIANITLGVPGMFNLENAVAALAVGYLLGLDKGHLQKALRSYQGVQRRFDFRIRSKELVYIDDYAHHPEELKACISSVRELYPGRKLTGIFQPHLFSRTRDLADGFAKSLDLLDEAWLLDIYPAREKPIPGVTSQMLLDRMKIGEKRLITKDIVVDTLINNRPEVLLTLGAGDIDQLAQPITEALAGGTE
jgi:UDP-N-acetylmuramate--alanine ligase